MRSLPMVLLLLLVLAIPSQAAEETIFNSPEGSNDAHPAPGEIFNWSRDVLFTNGPLYNCENCGGAGVHWSVLQDVTWGENTYGWGVQIANDNKMADDFTIPAGETWRITGVTFFVYQTGSGLQSTINDVRMVIYDTLPANPENNIIYGNWGSNLLSATSWSSVYRTLESASGGTTRPIMAVTAEVDAVLGEGQYWVGASFGGTLSSGPWLPPIPIIDDCDTGDAMQSTGTAPTFAYVTDSGSFCQKGMPFIVEGEILPTPTEKSSWGEVKALFR